MRRWRRGSTHGTCKTSIRRLAVRAAMCRAFYRKPRLEGIGCAAAKSRGRHDKRRGVTPQVRSSPSGVAASSLIRLAAELTPRVAVGALGSFPVDAEAEDGR